VERVKAGPTIGKPDNTYFFTAVNAADKRFQAWQEPKGAIEKKGTSLEKLLS